MYFNKVEGLPKQVTIRADLFEREAQELNIHNFAEFYDSSLFINKHKYRAEDKTIICDLE